MSYDFVSSFYDRLAKLVFGTAQLDAQAWSLHHIPVGARILIAGGGSGWILEEISKIHSKGLTITYIDASPRMIALARQRGVASNKVVFIADTIEKFAADSAEYDIVITPFLFDNFSEDTAALAFSALHSNLRATGKWLYVDFAQTPKLSQKLLLKSMYFFFGLLAGIKARQLPNMERLFGENGYKALDMKQFHSGFITAIVYTQPIVQKK